MVDGKANAWLVVQEKAQRAMVALSARLRLCPQARFDRLVAATNARYQGPRKPWLDDDGQPYNATIGSEPNPLDEFRAAGQATGADKFLASIDPKRRRADD